MPPLTPGVELDGPVPARAAAVRRRPDRDLDRHRPGARPGRRGRGPVPRGGTGRPRRVPRGGRRAGQADPRGIVSTYDTGQSADGLPFLVTERAVGPTLAELVERHGPMAPTRVVGIGAAAGPRPRGRPPGRHRARVDHRGRGAGREATTGPSSADSRRAACGPVSRAPPRTARRRPCPGPHARGGQRNRAGRGRVTGRRASRPGGPGRDPRQTSSSPPRRRKAPSPPPPGWPRSSSGWSATTVRPTAETPAVPAVPAAPTAPTGLPATSAGGRAGAIAGIAVGLLLAVAVGVAAYVLFNGRHVLPRPAGTRAGDDPDRCRAEPGRGAHGRPSRTPSTPSGTTRRWNRWSTTSMTATRRRSGRPRSTARRTSAG